MKYLLIILFLLLSASAEESKNITSVRKSLNSLSKKFERKAKDGQRFLIQELISSSTRISKEQAEDIKAVITYGLAGKSFRALVASNSESKEIKDIKPDDAQKLAGKDKASCIFLYQIKDGFSSKGIELHYRFFYESRGKFRESGKSSVKLALSEEDGRLKVQKGIPDHNNSFLKFSLLSHGRKVGNGQCWTLAEQARRKIGIERRGTRDWGGKVDKKKVLPGDIMEIDRGTEVGHTAVVFSVQGSKIYLIHQNAPPYKSEMAVGVSMAYFNEKKSKYYFHRPGLPWK